MLTEAEVQAVYRLPFSWRSLISMATFSKRYEPQEVRTQIVRDYLASYAAGNR